MLVVAFGFLVGGQAVGENRSQMAEVHSVGGAALSAMPFSVQGDSVVIKQGSSLFLEPNIPNPFTHQTKISYTLDRETKVLLTVFDAFYNDVIILVEENSQGPGRYEIDFNPVGKFGTGMYFYSLTTSAGTETRRMLFIE